MASLKLLRVTSEYERFKQSSCQTTDELQRQMHEMKVNEARYKQIEEQLKRQLEETEEKNKRSKEEFGRRLIETQKKLTLKENDMEKLRESAETKMKVALEELSRQQKEFQDQITVLEEQASSVNESALEELQEDVTKWKTLFENLQEKVKPFQVQLDAFAAEKNLLLSQNCQAKTEVQQLSTQYAKLLGHQNNKQKIQHVLKLKEENLSLKEEVMKLREQTTKQQRQLGELGYKQDSRKKFNPAMAFKHSKENSTPLGDQNTV
ncbi:hyaluronan mediated motility receptor-like [Saccoglossus kowalevskii]|uniref:Hyaluronan mediated motility receptor-like n=1 Tax=Saccoglossus kowalevskii TaxID=10224 RepID=A0ABM0MNF1_SACKO|nr:PREDICTED: hyaluronan mediated motility receptor-like [Saccoglossus kowalevskii]